jgi:hypothetical protein
LSSKGGVDFLLLDGRNLLLFTKRVDTLFYSLTNKRFSFIIQIGFYTLTLIKA